jgi:hypothetical protein
MTTRAVNVVQSHSLGTAVAKQRMFTALNDAKNADPHIVVGDFDWRDSTHTFHVAATAYGDPVNGYVQITDTFVHVTTDDIAGPFVVVYLAVGRANYKIGSMLAEALKP